MKIDLDDFYLETGFPAVITPRKKHVTYDEFVNQIEASQMQLMQLLLKFGALLFRDFPVRSAHAFSQMIQKLKFGHFVNYIGGDSPRDRVDDGVYTSTEAPPSIHIPLHQELSFIQTFPRHIYFFCEVAPASQGETIIADARKIYDAFDADFRHHFQQKKLTYISRYYYKSKVMELLNRYQRSHKSWIEVFETENKEQVERYCVQNHFAWRWLQRDWIEIKQTRPALHTHPITKEIVWFNQAHLYDFNPRLLGITRYLGERLFYRKNTRLHEIQFGDGTSIPRKDLYHILDVLNKNTVAFPWHHGDVMILDNILAMHGRATFSGKRRVLTALTS
ncbi:MAG TPA: TauD/TfdA family dioxygenase [Gammaproteobacteria bacterium]|jgi:alpha-ketoglutarate-dependent taurine dioxygenase|nr:TauD/TfdA family dioxygenase [Gammaproteobacteria bacterium]